ncbi:MAG: pantetheine-phosphate adenylyltransferase [Campylobacter sp.]|nr:pantetheine-phosphate adenylyltransferase [Campylobacter sp.]
MNKICLYPGTFDPITNGHLDVIKRASSIFDEVIVSIAKNIEKQPFFSLNERFQMVQNSIENLNANIKVITFTGLLVDLARAQNAPYIIRGLRAVSDFEYELQMNYANTSLDSNVETVYLMPSLKYAFVSSSIVKSILIHGGNISHIVPKAVIDFIKGKNGVYSI